MRDILRATSLALAVTSPKFIISTVLVAVLTLSGCVSEEQRFAVIVSKFDQSIAEDDLSLARELFEEARQLTPEIDGVAELGRSLQIIELSKKAFLSGEASFAVGEYGTAAFSYLEVSPDDIVRFEGANSKVTEALGLLLSAEISKTGALSKQDFLSQGAVLQWLADVPEARLNLLEPLSEKVAMLSGSFREELNNQISRAIGEKRLMDAKQFVGTGVLALPNDRSLKELVLEIDDLLVEEREVKAAALKRERAAALSAMFKKTDTFEGIDWYYDRATYSSFAGNKFHLYIGKESSGQPWLRLRMQYFGADWVFWETLALSVDGEKYYFYPGYFEVERDNGSGNVWEWYDLAPDASDLAMIEKIISSNNTTLRFEGETKRADRVLSSAQKRAFKNVLLAFKALGG